MGRRRHLDAAALGPRNAKVGERMTATDDLGVSTLYKHDGTRWVLVATHYPRAYPKCWTLADGTRQAEHP